MQQGFANIVQPQATDADIGQFIDDSFGDIDIHVFDLARQDIARTRGAFAVAGGGQF